MEFSFFSVLLTLHFCWFFNLSSRWCVGTFPEYYFLIAVFLMIPTVDVTGHLNLFCQAQFDIAIISWRLSVRPNRDLNRSLWLKCFGGQGQSLEAKLWQRQGSTCWLRFWRLDVISFNWSKTHGLKLSRLAPRGVIPFLLSTSMPSIIFCQHCCYYTHVHFSVSSNYCTAARDQGCVGLQPWIKYLISIV